ncbi:MAG TPA: lytic transglycosylase domain-containing protein [Actinomycetota bacterium]|nr:lytic transglycosylase domain-containing protein [Actinomycetota bacterium]
MRTPIAPAVLLMLVACNSYAEGPPPRAVTSPQPSVTITGGEVVAPTAAIPTRPDRLRDDLVHTTRALKEAIERWRAGESERSVVSLLALRQQRIYQVLAARPGVARKVLGTLPRGLARFARETVTASGRLRALIEPLKDLPDWKTYRPVPAGLLRHFYEKAQRRFGVRWQILAAINFVESRFGRILGPSSAGALGPMQFIPATWDAYGNGGDVMDPHDAILGAARYLRASGAPDRMRAALHSYNNSYEYVHAIRTYARQMTRDPRNFYAYYFWQVFVLTTDGQVQLTGPGGVRPATP